VVLGGGFGFLPSDPPYAAVVQVSASGDVFSVGDWDFSAASFSGLLDDTASDITVVNAGKTDTDNSENITTTTAELDTEVSGFLIGTLYRASGGNERLVNGANQLVLEASGTVTLPAGGTISEGVVTSNPTIQLTPASPDVASQKLVIKGGGGEFYITENGIDLGTNNNVWEVTDSATFYVYAPTRPDETLYWWIVPEEGGISTTMSGTVELGSEGEGVFNFTVISDAYEFRVRVSPEEDNYDPESIGVESVLINGDAPTFGSDYHLHLTTGDLTETSIFLGTDDHNVRTTTDGKIQITTPSQVNKVWEFGTDGTLTFPSGNLSIGNSNGVELIQGNANVTIGILSQGSTGVSSLQWIDESEGAVAAIVVNSFGFGEVGDVQIITGNIGEGGPEHSWTFGTDGDLTLPTGGHIGPSGGKGQGTTYGAANDHLVSLTSYYNSGLYSSCVTAYADGTLNITAYNDGGPNPAKIWTFDNTGNLTLPAGGVISEGGGISGAIRLTPSGGANANQALLIYPTGNAEGDHVHLTAGGGSTELYLGNDFHYVKLVDGGNIELRSATANLSAQASWNFDTNGNIDARQTLGIKVPDGVPTDVAVINSTTGSWEANPNLSLATTGGTGTGLTVNVAETGGYASTIEIATAGTGYTNGDLITVTSGTSNATFTIVIAGRNTWQFGGTGNLTLPSANFDASPAPSSSPSIVFPSEGYIGASLETASEKFLIKSEGKTWTFDGSYEDLTFPGGTVFSSQNIVVVANANLTVTTFDGTSHFTTFGLDGNLILPETGYLRVGSGIVAGFASSPAPIISGFSSISAENFRFQGNGVNILSAVGVGTTDRLTNGGSEVALQANGVTTFGNTATISNNGGEFRLWADNDISVYRNGRDGYGIAENEVKVFADNTQITATTPNGLEIKQGNLIIPNDKAVVFANGVNILSTVGAGTYGNTQVASYLLNFDGDIEFTSSTARIGNVDVITVMDSVRSPAYQFSNGASILSNVVTKVSDSWIVTTGTNTYSFTVPEQGTYQLWVDCNIPNGILAYNATATVTNSNVPVVGAQYAWVYDGGGTPIDFTSIPNQFIGTANTIVRSNTAPSATTNRFDFGINNTSGGNVTVRYGYIKI
jgi:hypothetical protein